MPNAVSGASSNQASDAQAPTLALSGMHDASTAFAASAAAGHAATGSQLQRRWLLLACFGHAGMSSRWHTHDEGRCVLMLNEEDAAVEPAKAFAGLPLSCTT